MLKFLGRHYFPIFVFGGVFAGCIYTGNWAPFFVLIAICAVVALLAVIAAVIFALTRKRNVNIYIVEENQTFVPDDRFHKNKDHDDREIFH